MVVIISNDHLSSSSGIVLKVCLNDYSPLYICLQIVCLQEVDAEHFENLYHSMLFKHGYEGEFFKRTGKWYIIVQQIVDHQLTNR